MTSADDAMLVALGLGAQEGDSDALNDLLRHFIDAGLLRPPIRRFLFAEEDVQLAEQQALVAIATKLDSWRGGNGILAWARQIAANEAKMLIRARERRRGYEAEAANRTVEFVDRMSSHLATAADVERCIAQLDVQQGESLALRRQGHSYSSIAEQLGIPEGTVKTRVRLARAALAELLARNSQI